MKPKLFLSLFILLCLAATRTLADNQVLPVAIFDFDSSDESVNGLGPKVATIVNANLSADPNIITVERAELNKVLGEHELGLSGTVSPDTAAKVGQLTGAKVLVTGRVFESDNQLFLVAKVIGTETGRVYGELVTGPTEGSLADLSSRLAQKIANEVEQKGDTLVAKVKTHDDYVTAIKKALGGKKLPVVSVKITEQHISPIVIIDPAAQTEMALLLRESGFTVVDDQSTNKPDVEITGEAISEFGMQKGNLVSCRARIEVTAHDVASGKILAEDRQTSVGVDLAEAIAGKTALQNGADVLAERVIPQLVQ
jgi:hypothetical protein